MDTDKVAELRKRVYEDYEKKTPKSKQLYERACKTLVNGVSGNGRFWHPYPLYTTHGKGSKTWDIDGREYVDCWLNVGPVLLGHAHPDIVAAVRREVGRSSLFHNPGDLLVEAAELIKEVIPCAEKVRFVNTGTEAATAAARVVRAYTGKKKIVKFLGHYHGQDDQFLIAASGNKPTPGSAGIPEEHLVNTVLVKFNDINAIRRKLDEDNDIAAVFADPQLSRGSWTPSPGYLQELRKLTQEHGVLLVFDEIQTGFRLALGGAQEYFGVVPDLAFFAKGIAGGEKIAVLCGKEDVMGTISGAKGIAGSTAAVVTQSGTFNDGTGALAACIAGIKAFKKLKAEGAYESIFQLGSKLKAGIEQAFHDRGLPCHVNNLGPTTHVFITDLEPDFDAYCALDRTVLILFHLSLINEGLLFTNPQNGVSILSFAHTEEDIQRMIDGTGSALDNYRFAEAL